MAKKTQRKTHDDIYAATQYLTERIDQVYGRMTSLEMKVSEKTSAYANVIHLMSRIDEANKEIVRLREFNAELITKTAQQEELTVRSNNA